LCLNATADAESLVAPAPLSRFVHLSNERTLERMRQDSSFAKKQKSHRAPMLVVHPERLAGIDRDASLRQTLECLKSTSA